MIAASFKFERKGRGDRRRKFRSEGKNSHGIRSESPSSESLCVKEGGPRARATETDGLAGRQLRKEGRKEGHGTLPAACQVPHSTTAQRKWPQSVSQ